MHVASDYPFHILHNSTKHHVCLPFPNYSHTEKASVNVASSPAQGNAVDQPQTPNYICKPNGTIGYTTSIPLTTPHRKSTNTMFNI